MEGAPLEHSLGFAIRRTDVTAVTLIATIAAEALPDGVLWLRATPPIDALFVSVEREDGSSIPMSLAQAIAARIAVALDDIVWLRGARDEERRPPTQMFQSQEPHDVGPRSREWSDYIAFLGLTSAPRAFYGLEHTVPPLPLSLSTAVDASLIAHCLSHRPSMEAMPFEDYAGFLIEGVDHEILPRVVELARSHLRALGEGTSGRILRLSAARGVPILHLELPFHADDLRRTHTSIVDAYRGFGAELARAFSCEVWMWRSPCSFRDPQQARATRFAADGSSKDELLLALARKLGLDLRVLVQLAATDAFEQPLDLEPEPARLADYLRDPPPPYIPPGPSEETLQSFMLPRWMVREAEQIALRLGCSYNQVFVIAWELGKRSRSTELEASLPADLQFENAREAPPLPSSEEKPVRRLLAVTWPLIDEGLALAAPSLAEAYRAARAMLFGAYRADPRAPWVHPVLNPSSWKDYQMR